MTPAIEYADMTIRNVFPVGNWAVLRLMDAEYRDYEVWMHADDYAAFPKLKGGWPSSDRFVFGHRFTFEAVPYNGNPTVQVVVKWSRAMTDGTVKHWDAFAGVRETTLARGLGVTVPAGPSPAGITF